MCAYQRMRQAVVKANRDKTNICKSGRYSAELINLMGLAEREREGAFLFSIWQVLPFTTLP